MLMNSAKYCKGQAAECTRFMKSALTTDQARLLENISVSWTRLAGQIDRYNALVREQRELMTPQQGLAALRVDADQAFESRSEMSASSPSRARR
jgi:hypothetical protein